MDLVTLFVSGCKFQTLMHGSDTIWFTGPSAASLKDISPTPLIDPHMHAASNDRPFVQHHGFHECATNQHSGFPLFCRYQKEAFQLVSVVRRRKRDK